MNSQEALCLTYKTGISNLKLEEIISKDGHCSFYCTINILKDKFELGEEAISQNDYDSLDYSIKVLKRRFVLGENIIGKSNYYSLDYFIKILEYNHE